MIILGIDPGIAIVGYGVLSSEKGKFQAIDYGVITTSKDEKIPQRLALIEQGLNALIDKYKPDCIALEELFFQNNQKTAITVAEARGVLLLTAVKRCSKLYEYTPLQIKQAITGYGNADKKQVQFMVKALLNLKQIPKPDDAADALAVALTCGQVNKFNDMFRI
ncbi:MAG: crossover junction endodeoxyribonuclease RuvC [Clostridia bacterium]|nr:crossover junction endodeoxyribonuclease RuvC [Clostridia bacterium]MDY5264680.1 crossover junction endodeoxyribonuclease RuvC [Eubacteriales bacterium]